MYISPSRAEDVCNFKVATLASQEQWSHAMGACLIRIGASLTQMAHDVHMILLASYV